MTVPTSVKAMIRTVPDKSNEVKRKLDAPTLLVTLTESDPCIAVTGVSVWPLRMPAVSPSTNPERMVSKWQTRSSRPSRFTSSELLVQYSRLSSSPVLPNVNEVRSTLEGASKVAVESMATGISPLFPVLMLLGKLFGFMSMPAQITPSGQFTVSVNDVVAFGQISFRVKKGDAMVKGRPDVPKDNDNEEEHSFVPVTVIG